MTSENASENKINFQIFRLVTPIMIAILGFFCVRELDRIDQRLESTEKNLGIVTVAVAEIHGTVQSIQDRVIRDETIYDKRGFR